jgi:hypothetical protein
MVETESGNLRESRASTRGSRSSASAARTGRRRSRASLIVLSTLLAAVIAACGSPIGGLGRIPPLGPNDILAASLVRLEGASTLHVKASVGGSLNASALSSLAGGLPIGLLGKLKLDGSSITGDVDVSRRAAHLSASFPVLFGAKAEVIVVDGSVYTRVSLLGDNYTKSTLPSSPFLATPAPGATFGQAEALASVRAALAVSGATATLLGTDSVEGRPAYHLTLDVPASGLTTVLGLIGGGSAGGAGIEIGSIGYWVYVDTLQPARLTAAGSSAALGDLNIDATIDGYGQPVTIAAPAPGQVNGG